MLCAERSSSHNHLLLSFRVGAMYSLNDDVMSGYHGVCHITMTSNHTGSIMAAVMEDAAFTKQYLHKCQQGLKSAKEAATTVCASVVWPCVLSIRG